MSSCPACAFTPMKIIEFDGEQRNSHGCRLAARGFHHDLHALAVFAGIASSGSAARLTQARYAGHLLIGRRKYMLF